MKRGFWFGLGSFFILLAFTGLTSQRQFRAKKSENKNPRTVFSTCY